MKEMAEKEADRKYAMVIVVRNGHRRPKAVVLRNLPDDSEETIEKTIEVFENDEFAPDHDRIVDIDIVPQDEFDRMNVRA